MIFRASHKLELEENFYNLRMWQNKKKKNPNKKKPIKPKPTVSKNYSANQTKFKQFKVVQDVSVFNQWCLCQISDFV